MKFSDAQITAFVRYVTILGNIQKRCLLEGIDIHADVYTPKRQGGRILQKNIPPASHEE